MVEIVSLTDSNSTHSVIKSRNGRTVTINTPCVQRVNKVSAGGAFGEADFFLGRKHRYFILYVLIYHGNDLPFLIVFVLTP